MSYHYIKYDIRVKGLKMSTANIMYLLAIIIFIIVAVFVAVILCKAFRRHDKRRHLDEMEGKDFEYYCAGLLENNGFIDVEVTKASGDYGIDILAEKDGVSYAIQCKRYNDTVGVKAIQEAYAGRDYYDRMVGAVMTNQYFTGPAVEAAKKLKILLWDRDYVEGMMED